MVRAIEYTVWNLPVIHEAYSETVGKFNKETIDQYAGQQYYFVHDTDRMQPNFVMTKEEVIMVYDINPLFLNGQTTFFRIY